MNADYITIMNYFANDLNDVAAVPINNADTYVFGTHKYVLHIEPANGDFVVTDTHAGNYTYSLLPPVTGKGPSTLLGRDIPKIDVDQQQFYDGLNLVIEAGGVVLFISRSSKGFEYNYQDAEPDEDEYDNYNEGTIGPDDDPFLFVPVSDGCIMIDFCDEKLSARYSAMDKWFADVTFIAGSEAGSEEAEALIISVPYFTFDGTRTRFS